MKEAPVSTSPSGCPIYRGDRVYKTPTLRVLLIGGRRVEGPAFHTLRSALRYVSTKVEWHERWRIVQIPAGEPWDYDGVVVASVDTRARQ